MRKLFVLGGFDPDLEVLWAQWEGWDHTAELHPLYVFEILLLLKCCFTSTETVGLLGTGAQDSPPRLSHSS